MAETARRLVSRRPDMAGAHAMLAIADAFLAGDSDTPPDIQAFQKEARPRRSWR